MGFFDVHVVLFGALVYICIVYDIINRDAHIDRQSIRTSRL